MRVLILGVGGFAGTHLARYLMSKKSVRIFGADLNGLSIKSDPGLKEGVKFYRCDFMQSSAIHRLIKTVRPDRIFHLAGQTSVPQSWRDPVGTMNSNLISTQYIFDAVRKFAPKARIHVACSSEEYGRCPVSRMPIRETELLRPVTPYAVSKVAQEYLAMQQQAAYGIDVVRTRAFNHLGPGQREFFAASSFARQVALIELGRTDCLMKVGNLAPVRDFTDVRDVVRAYWLALERCPSGEVYNVCSGRGRAIADILELLLRLSRRPIKVVRDPSKLRSSDLLRFVGCPAKFERLTGWKRRIAFERSIADLLEDWRLRLGPKGSV